MQINELLLKNFGKFHDRQIDLDEGINLIHGENESGKSTIHTFIRGMLFGIERGRGRAAQNDTFSIYEPWENPNYYSGILKFKSGEKHFRIERNFDKYSKKAELICEEDGEVLSVEDGDLQMLLGEMDAERYDNTVSMSQRNAQMGESIVAELKNYATNYYTSGNGEIDLAGALEQLRGRKKILENEISMDYIKNFHIGCKSMNKRKKCARGKKNMEKVSWMRFVQKNGGSIQWSFWCLHWLL